MRTKITRSVESNTQTLKFGYWKEDTEEFIPITLDKLDEFADILNTSRELLGALHATFGDFQDSINADLLDIWERLNKVGEQCKK